MPSLALSSPVGDDVLLAPGQKHPPDAWFVVRAARGVIREQTVRLKILFRVIIGALLLVIGPI